MDDLVPSHFIEVGTPLGRLASACKAFATWEPHLGPSNYQQSVRAEAAAKAMSRIGAHWIGPEGPFFPAAYEVTILWSSSELHRFTALRDALPSTVWRGLREKMSDRFVSRWSIPSTLTRNQQNWFAHSNAQQLSANLEDILLYAFCALHAKTQTDDVELLANLLELWHAGAYVVGATDTRLVLLHGS